MGEDHDVWQYSSDQSCRRSRNHQLDGGCLRRRADMHPAVGGPSVNAIHRSCVGCDGGVGCRGSFSVLGASTVTNTGPTNLGGDLGVSPGTAITGFPPGTLQGTTHSADVQSGAAHTDLQAAYNDAAGRTPTEAVAGDLVGRTLNAGVYNSASIGYLL